jgi:integrase
MTSQHPRLRSHTRKRKSGRVVTYYVYDMRGTGKPDVALGADYTAALKRWDELHNRAPRIAGTLQEAFDRYARDVLPTLKPGTRADYAKHLRHLAPFGPATWDAVRLPTLVEYLSRRKGKTQANRELSVLSAVWNKARLWGLTELPWPAHGMSRAGWKNKEAPRKYRPTWGVFEAVYAHADQTLRDCMDVATATGMRLTDCVSILLPRDGVLRLEASKTGKAADFQIDLSAVLPAVVERRRGYKVAHLMLLSTPTRPVSLKMLSERWGAARAAAAAAAVTAGDAGLAAAIRGMYLRDARKLAADLAASDTAAAELLQHDDVRLTRKHYRSTVAQLKPTR